MDLEDIISLNNGISFNIHNHDVINKNYKLIANLLFNNITSSNDDLDCNIDDNITENILSNETLLSLSNSIKSDLINTNNLTVNSTNEHIEYGHNSIVLNKFNSTEDILENRELIDIDKS